MSVDRVATNSQSQYLLSQIMQANKALDRAQTQVASGKVADNYAGIGDKTAALEAARAAAARADGYQAGTQLAVTQTDLQDTQLTALSGLADQLKQAVTDAVSKSDGTGLMATAQSVFQQAAAILNTTDSNGNYIYAGQTTNAKPFTATSLDDLATAPVASFFANGELKKTVQIGDSQTQQIGVLASDIGTDLMAALKAVDQLNGSTDALGGALTADQTNNLTSMVLPDANTAISTINSATGENGVAYNILKDSVTTQQSLSSLYGGFVSDIENVDMATALTNFNQSQIALQAALSVTARLGQISLLNYLPATTSTG